MTIRGFVIATTWAGQAYGREWLSNVLSGCLDCGLCEARVYLSAPTIDRLDSTDGQYTLVDAALTDGPKELARPHCPEICSLEFTITSERGEFFAPPVLEAGIQGVPEDAFPPGCLPFDEWLCSQPSVGIAVPIVAPRIGTLGVIVSIDATQGVANGIEIGLYSSCAADATLLQRIVVGEVPFGSYLTIDSGKQRVTIVDADGVVRDGIGYLIPDDDLDIEWIDMNFCDPSGCIVVKRLANCSETTGTEIAVLTQLKVR